MHGAIVVDDDQRIGIEKRPAEIGCNHPGAQIFPAACSILSAIAGINHLSHFIQNRQKGFLVHSQFIEDAGIAIGNFLEEFTTGVALLHHGVAVVKHVGNFFIILVSLARC